MNSTSTVASPPGALTLNEGYFSRRTWADWLFAVVAIVGALFAFSRYHASMDVYEKAILAGELSPRDQSLVLGMWETLFQKASLTS